MSRLKDVLTAYHCHMQARIDSLLICYMYMSLQAAVSLCLPFTAKNRSIDSKTTRRITRLQSLQKSKRSQACLQYSNQKLNLSSKSHNSIGEKRRLHSSTKKEDQTKLRHSRKHSKGWNGYPCVVLLFSPRPRSAIHRPFGWAQNFRVVAGIIMHWFCLSEHINKTL